MKRLFQRYIIHVFGKLHFHLTIFCWFFLKHLDDHTTNKDLIFDNKKTNEIWKEFKSPEDVSVNTDLRLSADTKKFAEEKEKRIKKKEIFSFFEERKAASSDLRKGIFDCGNCPMKCNKSKWNLILVKLCSFPKASAPFSPSRFHPDVKGEWSQN